MTLTLPLAVTRGSNERHARKRENDMTWLNHYTCSSCGTEWTDEWSHQSNDRCPKCDTETEPHESEEIANMTKEIMEQFIAKHGITMIAEFIPYSKSEGYVPDTPLSQRMLNWMVTIAKGGKEIITTPYRAGIGHCPSYVFKAHGLSNFETEAIRRELETGRSQVTGRVNEKILPTLPDVLYCLVADSDVFNYPNFESWAADMGHDTDSRKAEATYRECLKIAVKLRLGFGDEALAELQEAATDY